MRIGFDGTPLIGSRTGIGNYTYDLIDALAQLAPPDDLRVMPVSWRMAAAAQVPPHDNVELVRRLAPARPLRAAWQRMAFPPLEALLRCDVFHATNYVAPRAWRTPTVVTVHDLWFLENPHLVGPAEAALGSYLPGILKRAAAILTVSSYVREQLVEWQPRLAPKVTAIPIAPHPRSAESRRPASLASDDFLLSLGTVNARKNLPLTLRALALARRSGLDVPLVVAGGISDGQHGRRALAHLMTELDLKPETVHLLGFADDSEVTYLLEHARALISSSIHEGFGLPLIEAMGASVPVVAVSGGAVDEVVDGAAMLVSDEPEALAEAILTVLTDDSLRASLIARGLTVAHRYDWGRTAVQTMGVYRAVS